MRHVTMMFLWTILATGALPAQSADTLAPGRLIPATSAMETAWDLPRDPMADTSLGASVLGREIRRGYEIFVRTPKEAPRFTGNALSCNNCHLNAGQREKALPLVGIAAAFPEYNKRQGILISLEDRIVGCFLRSLNATAKGSAQPTASSREVLAVSAYLTWLSQGRELGALLPWRGHNTIEKKNVVPIAALDARKGRALYVERCANCHGEDGQGVAIGDRKPGPLWGPRSWNDGAGAARVYTLAGMIRHDMPYIDPGSLTDEEAQHIAYFIDTQPRPVFPFKASDYKSEALPDDALYYHKRP